MRLIQQYSQGLRRDLAIFTGAKLIKVTLNNSNKAENNEGETKQYSQGWQ